MGVVQLEYRLDKLLKLNEYKSILKLLKSYFCFENYSKLYMSNAIDENGKLVFLENHFYTAKLEKRYEQFFLNYDNYNSSWNHYEDDKIIVDFYYATICSNFLQFVFVDKEKRIQEDTVLNFNKELVSLLKSTDIKILKGEWLDEANMLYIYDLPIK